LRSEENIEIKKMVQGVLKNTTFLILELAKNIET
jgi:hypothetical protein